MGLTSEAGSLIAAGCDDGLVRIWDLEVGGVRGPPLTAHDGPVTALATGMLDGQGVLVSTTHGGPVRTWWLASGAPVGPPLGGEEPIAVGQVDGQLVVVSADEHDRVCVWDLTTASVLVASTHHDAPLSALAVADVEDRQVVISGDGEGQLTVSDVATGQLIARMAGGHRRQVGAIATTVLEGRPVAVSGGNDGTVRRWDLATGEPLGEPLHGHRGPLHAPGRIYALAITSLDGRPVAVSSGWDGELWVWDLARGERPGDPLDDLHGDVQALAVSHTGVRPVLVCGGIDEPVLRVWDLNHRRLERVLQNDAHVLALAPVPSGSARNDDQSLTTGT